MIIASCTEIYFMLVYFFRYTGALKSLGERIFYISLTSHWLCHFNSAINPVIYNFMSGWYCPSSSPIHCLTMYNFISSSIIYCVAPLVTHNFISGQYYLAYCPLNSILNSFMGVLSSTWLSFVHHPTTLWVVRIIYLSLVQHNIKLHEWSGLSTLLSL